MNTRGAIDPFAPAAYLIATAGADFRLPVDKAFAYVLESTGLFKCARTLSFRACVPIARWSRPLPGLQANISPGIRMIHGLIPGSFLDAALTEAKRASWAQPKEIMFQVVINGRRAYLRRPAQWCTAARIKYRALEGENAILDLHSHHSMRASFSTTDNGDEQGLKIYGVMGQIFKRPAIRLRVGIYGDFHPIPATAVFSAPINLHDMNHETERRTQE